MTITPRRVAFHRCPLPPVALVACALFAASILPAGSAFAKSAPKVEICHIPPGNPANFHTIKVSENALAAHLAHGDVAGPCDAACAVLCDDGNACTIDDAGDCEDNGCPTTPEMVDCNDGNSCTADSCDSALGCEYTAMNGSPCMVGEPGACEEGIGVCDSAGACTPDPTPNCCVTTADCVAVDENLCTLEECQNNKCITISTIQCVTSACEMSVCVETTGECTPPQPVVCDELPCHENGCDPQTGCYSEEIEGCCLGDFECDDQNNCTTDTCLGVDGCVSVPCAMEDACNVLLDCDPFTCEPFTESVDCNDTNACTSDSCVEGLGCVNDALDCDDGDQCTAESCDPLTGCANNPVSCDDGNMCTAESCDPLTGCASEPISCDDASVCTTDICDPLTGCANTPISCDDGNLCTDDFCEDPTGCRNRPRICPQGETCNPDNGLCEPGCFTMDDALGTGGTVEQCFDACEASQACPAGGCFEKLFGVNRPAVEACLAGNQTACDQINAELAQQGCNICGSTDPGDCNNRPPGLVLDGADWSGIVATGPERAALRDACVNEVVSQGCGAPESALLSACNSELLATGSACLTCVSPGGNNSSGPCSSCATTLEIRFYQLFGCQIDIPACVN